MKFYPSFLLAMVLTNPVFGGSTIDPVTVELNSGRGTVSITNIGNTATGYEVRALDWSVSPDGSDTLSPTDGLVVFPPLFRLSPGQTLTLRLREAVPTTGVESAYRLEITEEPPEVAGTGVGIQMQYLTSAFAKPEGATAAIECRIQGSDTLRIENIGGARTRIDAVLANGVNVTNDVEFTGRTVLAQTARFVSLPSTVDARNVEIDASGVANTRCQ